MLERLIASGVSHAELEGYLGLSTGYLSKARKLGGSRQLESALLLFAHDVAGARRVLAPAQPRDDAFALVCEQLAATGCGWCVAGVHGLLARGLVEEASGPAQILVEEGARDCFRAIRAAAVDLVEYSPRRYGVLGEPAVQLWFVAHQPLVAAPRAPDWITTAGQRLPVCPLAWQVASTLMTGSPPELETARTLLGDADLHAEVRETLQWLLTVEPPADRWERDHHFQPQRALALLDRGVRALGKRGASSGR